MIQITKNLKLLSVQENNVQDQKLIAVVCYFEFFGEEGAAYVVVKDLDKPFSSYGMKEMDSELFDSFDELTDDHWDEIKEEIKKFIEEWESYNNYDEDE